MNTFLTNSKSGNKVDLWLILVYLILILFGWANIYSAVYSEDHAFIFDFSQRYGMQFVWICISIITSIFILYIINPLIYRTISPLLYLIMLFLLFSVIFLGREVKGSHSWFFIGSVGIQPAEFSKITTSLMLATIMSQYNFSLNKTKDALKGALVVLIPILLIIMEKETGSALIYLSLIFVFFREGLSGWFIILGFSVIALFIITIVYSPFIALIAILSVAVIIRFFVRPNFKTFLISAATIVLIAFVPKIPFKFVEILKPEIWGIILFVPIVFIWLKDLWTRKERKESRWLFLSMICGIIVIFSVNFVFNNVLQAHQKARIENLLGITEDLHGIGYNVHQSKIAIGSGGLLGKGFLHGTQTKYNFVPEQSTDFIFCTVGEEWGFVGSIVLLSLYIFLIIRIIVLAEKNKDSFTRIYGYCVASIFMLHVFINIGMTIGLLPVIGIPLPFLSYGGSSMLSFTILLFIFIRLDMNRQTR